MFFASNFAIVKLHRTFLRTLAVHLTTALLWQNSFWPFSRPLLILQACHYHRCTHLVPYQ